MKKRVFAMALLFMMLISLTACGSKGKESGEQGDNKDSASAGSQGGGSSTDPGATDPWAKYENTVTIHLGAGLDPNATFPDGQSKDNNTYLDFIKEEFNIEIVYDWICSTSDFEQKMNLCIASNTLPDLMNVNATQYRAMLKYDQLQPIEEGYNACASDLLKAFASSGGEACDLLISNSEGEMMAIPAPNITTSNVNSLWIRQDWLDTLGLQVPKTVDELKEVARAFVEKDPDGNGKADTIGLLGPSNSGKLNLLGQNQFGLDPIFAAYGSYPAAWMRDESGNIYYGSTTPETKEALSVLAEMYKEGLIDPEMLVRDNSSEPALAGKVGMFFGPWWTGYTMSDSFYGENQIDWQAYNVPLNADGKFVVKTAAPTTQYIVASKNCTNPEAAAKIINLLLRDEQKWIADGLKETLNPSDAYPLFNVYDKANVIDESYDILKKYLAGEIKIEDVDFSSQKLLKNDMEKIILLKKEPLDDFSIKYWDLDHEDAKSNMGRLVSIMVGARPAVEEGYEEIMSVYYGKTDTMVSKWANLEKLEDETFAKIIMGQASIDTFDTFVKDWKAQGGDQIIKEMEELLK